jgi:flagellar protein FlaG
MKIESPGVYQSQIDDEIPGITVDNSPESRLDMDIEFQNSQSTDQAESAGMFSGEKQDVFSREELDEAVEMMNHSAATLDKNIKFNVVLSENLIQVQISDGESGELIRAIPPDNVLEVRKRVEAFLGLMLDERS